MAKKKAAKVTPKLTEGERELLSQMEEGYQLGQTLWAETRFCVADSFH